MNQTSIAFVLILSSTQLGAAPQDFAFTYQGELHYNQQPVDDQCDLVFSLYDLATGGAQVGVQQTLSAVVIVEGLFTAPLDFGDVYDGTQLYLEIAIGAGCGDAGATAETLPRTTLTSAPYSSYAMTSALTEAVDWSAIANRPAGLDDGDDDTPPTSYGAGVGLSLSGDSFSVTGSYRLPQGCANGQIASWNNGAWTCVNDQNSNQFWDLSGNTGTTPGTHFLGTADNQALELKVNGDRALSIEPTTGAPNIIGGSNTGAGTGILGATIGGGQNNAVNGDHATIGGGASNEAGRPAAQGATVGGGILNKALGAYSVISGGDSNDAFGLWATVAGGLGNYSAELLATVGGGSHNRAIASYSAIAGGQNNVTWGDYSAVLGGNNNVAIWNHSVIGGGELNIAGADSDSGLLEICGNGIDDDDDGQTDEAACFSLPLINPPAYAIVNGGFANKASSLLSAVGGGAFNRASAAYSTVGGGEANRASGIYATVIGGNRNVASGDYSTAGGEGAHARLRGQRAFGAGMGGDAQSSAYTLSRQTFDATPARLTLAGGLGPLTLPEDMTMTFDIQVAATISGSQIYYNYSVNGGAQNDSGNIFVNLGTPYAGGNGAGSWSVVIVGNSSDDSLDIVVTGAAATTIRWVATARTTEVIFP